jgi:hypothetical protein
MISELEIAIHNASLPDNSFPMPETIQAVNKAVADVEGLLARLDELSVLGVLGEQNLLRNGLRRSIRESQVYLSSALDSLKKAKQQLEAKHG